MNIEDCLQRAQVSDTCHCLRFNKLCVIINAYGVYTVWYVIFTFVLKFVGLSNYQFITVSLTCKGRLSSTICLVNVFQVSGPGIELGTLHLSTEHLDKLSPVRSLDQALEKIV